VFWWIIERLGSVGSGRIYHPHLYMYTGAERNWYFILYIILAGQNQTIIRYRQPTHSHFFPPSFLCRSLPRAWHRSLTSNSCNTIVPRLKLTRLGSELHDYQCDDTFIPHLVHNLDNICNLHYHHHLFRVIHHLYIPYHRSAISCFPLRLSHIDIMPTDIPMVDVAPGAAAGETPSSSVVEQWRAGEVSGSNEMQNILWNDMNRMTFRNTEINGKIFPSDGLFRHYWLQEHPLPFEASCELARLEQSIKDTGEEELQGNAFHLGSV